VDAPEEKSKLANRGEESSGGSGGGGGPNAKVAKMIRSPEEGSKASEGFTRLVIPALSAGSYSGNEGRKDQHQQHQQHKNLMPRVSINSGETLRASALSNSSFADDGQSARNKVKQQIDLLLQESASEKQQQPPRQQQQQHQQQHQQQQVADYRRRGSSADIASTQMQLAQPMDVAYSDVQPSSQSQYAVNDRPLTFYGGQTRDAYAVQLQQRPESDSRLRSRSVNDGRKFTQDGRPILHHGMKKNSFFLFRLSPKLQYI
jgi:hypothetical protein